MRSPKVRRLTPDYSDVLALVTKLCCCGGRAGVYVALFHWLVTKLNRTTGAPHVAGGPAPRTVSILDIYGFEVHCDLPTPVGRIYFV